MYGTRDMYAQNRLDAVLIVSVQSMHGNVQSLSLSVDVFTTAGGGTRCLRDDEYR